jgi:hypothetical protein
MIINEDDIKSLSGLKYWNEKEAKEFWIDQKGKNNVLINEAIKHGISYMELYSIREYTGTSNHFNNVAKKYTNSITGDVNFDREYIADGKDEYIEKVITKNVELNEYFDTLLSAAKSINFYKSSGKTAKEANGEKLKAAEDVSHRVNNLLDDNNKDSKSFTSKQIKDLLFLQSISTKIKSAIKNDKEIETLVKPSSFKDFEIVTKEKVKSTNKLGKDQVEFNGFKGANPVDVAKLKVLCHTVRKLEEIKHKDFHVEGVLNRGVDIPEDQRMTFAKQHAIKNESVMHQWGSSTSWNEDGYKNRNTMLRITGSGAHINMISSYEGNESEVIVRPFTLYKNISFTDWGKNGTAEVYLHKIL